MNLSLETFYRIKLSLTEEINKALNSSLVNFVNGDLGFATLKNIFQTFCLLFPAHKGLAIRVCCPLMDFQRTSLQ